TEHLPGALAGPSTSGSAHAHFPAAWQVRVPARMSLLGRDKARPSKPISLRSLHCSGAVARRMSALDQRGARTVVAHPCHEFPRIRARIGRELVAGMAQVVMAAAVTPSAVLSDTSPGSPQ